MTSETPKPLPWLHSAALKARNYLVDDNESFVALTHAFVAYNRDADARALLKVMRATHKRIQPRVLGSTPEAQRAHNAYVILADALSHARQWKVGR